ncbi:uncharacterized protein AB675_3450 [Cyphellophora attinorum]|uniref:DUF7587 domain-containing protein n=1 Tax=Cyphellophora attinorum TaxID=1664694 RepID=A0A0N1P010_9EURO|nr:uncharacterized protein AB675_3450 [Phialophora attinorum]KPI39602.1 hypothetical protein AB675_3450 [Phialophora attinorum]
MAPTKPPRHEWSEQDRILLALSYRFYQNEKSAMYKIWNQINHAVLIREGFANGAIANTALNSQFAEMKRTQATVYRQVFDQPVDVVRRQFRVHKDLLEDTAQKLNISLVLRVHPPAPSTAQPTNNAPPPTVAGGPFRREDWSPSTVRSDHITTQNSDLDSSHESPVASRPNLQSFIFSADGWQPAAPAVNHTPVSDTRQTENHVSEAQPTTRPSYVPRSVFKGVFVPPPPSTAPATPVVYLPDTLANVRKSPVLRTPFDSEGVLGKWHPVLLFRAFDPEHGLTARRFLDERSIPMPPTVLSSAFKDEVTPHLRGDTTYQSPFLSLTQSANRALDLIEESVHQKSVRKYSSDAQKWLAVFLYNDIDDEARQQFDGQGLHRNKMRPRLVPTICNDHGLDNLPNGYRGFGEFLVWGKLDSQPLLILDTTLALALIDVLKNMTMLCPEAAEDLLPFVKDVVPEWRDTLVRALVTSQKIPGADRPDSATWQTFADMFYAEEDQDAARSRRATSLFSHFTVEHANDGENVVIVEEDEHDVESKLPRTTVPRVTNEADLGEDVEMYDEGAQGIENEAHNSDSEDDWQTVSTIGHTSVDEHGSTPDDSVTMLQGIRDAAGSPTPVGQVQPLRVSRSPEQTNAITIGDEPLKKPVVIDLRDDFEEPINLPVAARNAPVEVIEDDIEMAEADSEPDWEIIGSAHRPLSHRSGSFARNPTQETPTPASRFPRKHGHMLD